MERRRSSLEPDLLVLVEVEPGAHLLRAEVPVPELPHARDDPVVLVQLNENNRVVPGVGEFGDRYFGTEEMRARFDLDEDEEIGFE